MTPRLSSALLTVRAPVGAARRCFRPEPRLRRVYGTVVLPGGPAADAAIGAPPGTARLLERLLHARNARVGRPLDQLGGKFGSSSSTEVTTIELTFSASDAPGAFALVESWLTEPPHSEDVADAIRLVRMESGRLPGPATRVLSEARRLLSGGTTVAPGADPPPLEESPAALSMRQSQLLNLGWVTAAVGPASAPWGSDAGYGPLWRPVSRRGERAEQAQLAADFGTGSSRVFVCVARGVAGLGLRLDPGELAAAVLEYGQERQAQQRLAALAGPSKPAVHHRRYGDLGFLAVVTEGRPGDEPAITEAADDVFRTLTDTSPEHARRRLVHHLELMVDTPRRRAAEEGLTSLYGAPSLLERLDHIRRAPIDDIRRALQTVADSPAARVTVRL